MTVRAKKAYTLIELLIALGLLIVLMGALWTMVDTFSAVFMRGEHRAERSQLIRSLSQILEADLNAAIQDPLYPTRNASNTAEVVRHFGLRGSEHALQVDVVQINPFKTSDVSDQVSVEAPELKTVYYNFQPITLSGQSGLLRREIDFETPGASSSSASSQNEDTIGSTVPSLGDMVVEETLEFERRQQPPQSSFDLERMLAPEVVQCRFSYFDGRNWFNSWDSIQKNGLPVAIAVDLKLLNFHEVQTYQETRDEAIWRRATDQRIVVRVPSTSLENQTELQRDQPMKPQTTQEPHVPPPMPPMEFSDPASLSQPLEPVLQPEPRKERSRFRE